MSVTAKRLRPKAQGCFNPGDTRAIARNPERVALADATLPLADATRSACGCNPFRVDNKPAIPRVEATLGFETQPLRGKRTPTDEH